MIAKNLYDPQNYTRPPFRDTDRHDPRFEDASWVVELKQDGIWGVGVVVDGNLTIYNTTYSTMKGSMQVDQDLSCVLLGEYMFGSNWAFRHGCAGQYIVYDLVVLTGRDLRSLPFHERRSILVGVYQEYLQANPLIQLSSVWPVQAVDLLWQHFIVEQDYEGLVFKYDLDTYHEATWYRQKLVFDQDYVCMGFDEGQGRLEGKAGSIIGGLYKNGQLMPICHIGGGLSDTDRTNLWQHQTQFIGKVFTAIGMKLFPSGALRHPNFKCWRPDKSPLACVWK